MNANAVHLSSKSECRGKRHHLGGAISVVDSTRICILASGCPIGRHLHRPFDSISSKSRIHKQRPWSNKCQCGCPRPVTVDRNLLPRSTQWLVHRSESLNCGYRASLSESEPNQCRRGSIGSVRFIVSSRQTRKFILRAHRVPPSLVPPASAPRRLRYRVPMLRGSVPALFFGPRCPGTCHGRAATLPTLLRHPSQLSQLDIFYSQIPQKSSRACTGSAHPKGCQLFWHRNSDTTLPKAERWHQVAAALRRRSCEANKKSPSYVEP